MVSAWYNKRAGELDLNTGSVVMAPGSSWSDTEGFNIQEFDYANKQDYVDELLEKCRPKLPRKKLMTPILFGAVEHEAERCFLIDFPAGEVRDCETSPDVPIVIDVPVLVLNDCTRKFMFSAWTPSKRLKIHIK